MDIDDDDGAVRRMLAPPLDDVDNDDGLVDGPRPQQPIVDPEDGAAAADQDSDEEEEEEPEDEEEEEEEEEHPGVIEGGVAEGHEGADKILLATQADIVSEKRVNGNCKNDSEANFYFHFFSLLADSLFRMHRVFRALVPAHNR